ncbi:MAG: 16S rRNA pseudouridine516 synthase [Zhongshania sp.]|jgi:16S rRNA pseudouridine516 synthase
MASKSTRLDRFISAATGIKRSDIRLVLAQNRIRLDGDIARDCDQRINFFSRIELDGQLLQANIPRYLMMNKPTGVVSACRDDRHRTVIDLIDSGDSHQLHLPGRLDFNSTGLLLLTNDGDWSRRLSLPSEKVAKDYRVTLADPLHTDYIDAFAEGMYFAYENITTLPAQLRILSSHEAAVTLVEGRYHQIKRMFGRFQNEVVGLHRIAIGGLVLDAQLTPGEYRDLTAEELVAIWLPRKALLESDHD